MSESDPDEPGPLVYLACGVLGFAVGVLMTIFGVDFLGL